MMIIILLAVLAGSIFIAYKLHDYLDMQGNKYALVLSAGFVLVVFLAMTAVQFGLTSIAADLHLGGTILVLIAIGKYVGAKYSEKLAVIACAMGLILSIGFGVWLGVDHSSRCYADWDGRSNPTVCN
jgi:hypothetical protein